jgi:hypothetical protein
MGQQRLWSDVMDATLRRMVAERFTASQIATALSRDMQRPITRNSVIGRVARLNLKLNGHVNRAGQHGGWFDPASRKQPKAPRSARKPAEAKAPAKPKPQHRMVPRKILPIEPPEIMTPVEPGADSVLFDKTTSVHCRWPLWPDRGRTALDQMFVCGAPASGTYCPAHHARATPRQAKPLLEELS